MIKITRLNILIYSPSNLRRIGGVEEWILEISTRLSKIGHKVTIIGVKIGKQNEYQKLGVKFKNTEYIELPFIRIPISRSPIPYSILTLLRYVKKADIILFEIRYALQDLLMLLLKSISQKKIVCVFQIPIFIPSRLLQNLYAKIVTLNILKYFEGIQVLNYYDRNLLKYYGINNIYVIPNGVDLQKFRPTSNKYVRNRKFRALFVGRLTEQKGVDILCKSINYLNSSEISKNIEFIVVGIGPLAPLVDKVSKQHTNVKFLGVIPHDELPGVYNSCDLLVMPSRYEGLGMVAIEAQACSLPVVTSDIPGPKDIIVSHKTGILIPPNDPFALTNAIKKFYNVWKYNHSQYQKFRIKSRKNATRFDWNIITKKINSMLLDLLT